MTYFNVCILCIYCKGIAIDERVLMMWKKHSDGVPDVLIDNTNILSKGAGSAALRLRRRYMREGYVPRDVPESATKESELNDSIRVLNIKRSDGDISEGTVSHIIDENNSSFADDLSDSGPSADLHSFSYYCG